MNGRTPGAVFGERAALQDHTRGRPIAGYLSVRRLRCVLFT